MRTPPSPGKGQPVPAAQVLPRPRRGHSFQGSGRRGSGRWDHVPASFRNFLVSISSSGGRRSPPRSPPGISEEATDASDAVASARHAARSNPAARRSIFTRFQKTFQSCFLSDRSEGSLGCSLLKCRSRVFLSGFCQFLDVFYRLITWETRVKGVGD